MRADSDFVFVFIGVKNNLNKFLLVGRLDLKLKNSLTGGTGTCHQYLLLTCVNGSFSV